MARTAKTAKIVNDTPELANEQSKAVANRPITVITEEIKFYKHQAGTSILEIGRRLTEAKEQLQHGEWLAWLSEQAEFSASTADRFMRIAREYSNSSPVTNLGMTKALILLALPADEREEFVNETHNIGGETKTAEDMSKRELEVAVRERNEALAVKAKLEAQLKELRNAEPVVLESDPAAIEQARKEAMKETEAKLKKKIEKANTDKDKAEAAKLAAEEALSQQKVEAAGYSEQVENLQKQLAANSSNELAVFKTHFEIAQSELNKMLSCIAELEDVALIEKMNLALSAMCKVVLEKVSAGEVK